MNETETRGVGKLVPHSSLVNIESVNIIISNHVTFSYHVPRKYENKFPSNKTLYELLREVGSMFKSSPDDIKLKRGDE